MDTNFKRSFNRCYNLKYYFFTTFYFIDPLLSCILVLLCYDIFYMAPLPKRKHSTQRKGKREKTRIKKLPQLVRCKECHRLKLPHQICPHCQSKK